MALQAKKFKEELLEKETIFIDVRTEEEYREAHIPGSINIPLNDLPSSEFVKRLQKNSKIRLNCHSGMRSHSAKNFLLAKGFKDVDDLQGGIVSWPYEIEK